ncbi:MAG: DUF1559 domain-containing protein [Planctomycetaceae bacterium]
MSERFRSSRWKQRYAPTNYVVCARQRGIHSVALLPPEGDGVMYDVKFGVVKFRDVVDGMSNTIAASEQVLGMGYSGERVVGPRRRSRVRRRLSNPGSRC